MTTVQKMVEELRKYPADAHCFIHDGEKAGLVICSPDREQTIGRIEVGETDVADSSGVEVVY